MLLGIMGSSGSGKTTLMVTISHRMKGNFDGELLFNGRPISEEVMIKISGFVPQHDHMFDQLTALEHLSLMANLKMDRRTTKTELKRRVDSTTGLLGMYGFLNTRVSFLSGGERKKVALAVQLLNDPPILFCDEITTGLDSYSAAHTVHTLKRVARTGKIVVCTIHQPASGVFGTFDEVLLMSDGRLVCQGPVPVVRQLFEKFNYDCPRMFNEADYVISVLNSDNEKVKRDVDKMCELSSSFSQTDMEFDSFCRQKGKTLDLRYNELWNDCDAEGGLHQNTSDAHGQLLLSWKNLNVSVKQVTQKFFKPSTTTYKRVLHNVSGQVRNGMLLGIMGSSGSGKTTLMVTISHRMKGNFDGELLFNGRPISEEVMIKISGFVPQHDHIFDQLTALEHLSLMANLKMDRRTTKSELKRRVDSTTGLLGMNGFLNTRVSFLSGGERKKVALAVQLLNDPPILFCDEITTGLDSYSAAHTVHTLKRVARTGKIVVCTIHQPASGVFGTFDEVLLMSDGRLVCQGPVPVVRQLFEKFNYECPRMFNEADYVISVLNSDSEKVKRDVDKMCELSSSFSQTDMDFDSFRNQKQWECMRNLQIIQPLWMTQFILIFNRSLKCFSRSYGDKLLEIGTLLFVSLSISLPYTNIKLDSQSSSSWEGVLYLTVIQCAFQFTYSTLPVYIYKFSIIHREIHNKVYPLSVFYVSELIILVGWIIVKMMIYCTIIFTVIGVEWGIMELLLLCLVAISSASFGILISSFFSKIENACILLTIYEMIALPICGLYVSIMSLSKLLYSLRRFSLYFLVCESISILFWEKVPFLPCNDVKNCLNSGQAVLNKYGYTSSAFHFDLTILISFSIVANVLGYLGVLKKMKKQPAY